MTHHSSFRTHHSKRAAYPAYRPSGVAWIGDIPEHWEVKALKRTFMTLNGATPRSGDLDYWDGDIPWATPDDLGNLKGSVLLTTRRMITEAGYASCGVTLAPKGSLILSTRAPIGHLAVAGVDMCTNQGCRSLVFRNGDHRRFFFYQLFATRSELQSLGQGSTFTELSRDRLTSVYLVSPPLDEQCAIAAFLDRETARIDALIEKKRRQIELLQEKRSALISHAVTKGLSGMMNDECGMMNKGDVRSTHHSSLSTPHFKDSGIEWLGEIPEHWEIHRLKHVASVQFSSVDKHTLEGEEPVRLCNYVDVYYNDFIAAGIEFMSASATQSEIARFQLCRGDVLVTKDSESWDDIAVPSYVAEKLDGVLCGYHLAHIRPHPRMLLGEYLFRAFSSRGINDQFRVAANGITRFGLGKYWLDNGLFPVPSLDEQRAIAAFLDRETARIDALVQKVNESIDVLQEYRTALISAAVTGKIDVRKDDQNE